MESNYSMKNLITLMDKNQFSKILRALFCRIPVIIVGNEPIQIDRAVSSITQLMPHRKELVYWNDFIEEDEVIQLYQSEESDFNIPRVIIRSSSNATLHAFRKIKKTQFLGWVLGYSLKNKMQLDDALEIFKENIPNAIVLWNKNDKIEILEFNHKWNGKDFGFEKNLIKKSIIETEVAIEKMKRVLQKKIKRSKKSSAGIIDAIMTFDTEEEKIRQNIYNQIIDEFVQAANRALAILSRIELLQELGFSIKISVKTLFKTIDYADVSHERLIEFLFYEYGIDFSECLGSGFKIDIGDSIESRWG
ncbi:MAG: hypothetical protein EU549_04270 [Promethearchaeota archaeon]|nr:MAG: hypothetical protein EU549_04270 [Candidatus Lokiarchaeota archaeon]